jgi:ATP-dependent DNA helicase PIF1
MKEELVEEMLKLHLNMDVSLEELGDSQELAIEKFKKGENILLVSAAGMGKSFSIKKMKKLTQKNMYLTATTGVAAYNIGGMTINSFLGIGSGEASAQELYRKVRMKEEIVSRIVSTDILVIDEISMMSACLFEKINYLMMAIKKSPKFFGGIQVIFSGDFMQAMPIFKKQIDRRLIFESELLLDNFNIIKLTKNYRQYDDLEFSQILTRMRMGETTSEDINTLNKKIGVKCNLLKEPMFLTSTNRKASEINAIRMKNIREEEKIYKMKSSGSKDLKKDLEYQMSIKNMDTLVLKKTARVMLVKNIDTEIGLVNGAMGIIMEFVQGYPEVKFDNGIIRVIKEENWELNVDGLKAKVKQLPLMISYASTVHKSQSLTLKNAILDLGDVFAEHMVYVALSRVSSLDGVYMNSFNPGKITVSQKCLEFVRT